MAGDIATAFVRLRPNTAGFQAEAEAQISGALSGTQKLLAAGLGFAGIAEGIKSLAEAASDHEKALTLTEQAVHNVGAEWVVYGKTVEQILDQQARDSGISFQQLYQGFIRLEGPLKNTPLALKDLSLAEDVARARGLQLSQVTVALVKAQEGNSTSLQRLGILTQKQTDAQDALKSKLADIKAAQTADTESKAKNYVGTIQLTDAQVALSKLSSVQLKDLAAQTSAQLDNAKATDKAATGVAAIAEVQKQYGGDAADFAKTAAGAYDRFRVSVEEAEASLGTALLPELTNAANAAGKYADELGSSKGASSALASGAKDVAGAVQGIVGVVKAGEPELKLLGELLSVGGGAGAQALAGTYLGYKLLAINIGLAQKAAGLFTATEATATTTTTDAAAATVAQTTATAELEAAQLSLFRVQELEIGAQQTLFDVTAIATTGLEAEAVAATEAEAATVDFAAVLAGIGAPELVGIAAVGAGLYLLNGYLDQGKDGLDELKKGYADLAVAGQTTKQQATDVKNLAADYTSLGEALRVADSQGSKSGFEDAAQRTKDAAKATDDWVSRLQKLEGEIGTTDPILKGQIDRLISTAQAVGKIPSQKRIQLILDDKTAIDNLPLDAAALQKAVSANPLTLTIDTQFAAPSGSLGNLPAKAKPLLDPKGLDKIFAAAGATFPQGASELGKKTATAFSTAFVQHIDVSSIATAFQTSLTTAQGNLVSQTTGIADAIGNVLDERLRLRTLAAQNTIDGLQKELDAESAAKTARDNAAALTTAQAKLASLQSVYGTGPLTADQATEIAAAQLAVTDAQGAITDAAKQQQIKALQDAQSSDAKIEAARKTATSRNLADLADELDHGKLTYAAYVKDVRAILAKENVNFKSAGALLGTAFADGFGDSLTSAFSQGKILGPLGSTLRSTSTATKPTNPGTDEAKAIQAVIDQIAGSGGKFTLDNVGKLPKGVDVASLVNAAKTQRSTDEYQTTTKKQGAQALTYAQETNDHLKTAVALLRAGRDVHVTVVDKAAAAKTRNTAKATTQ